MQERKFPDRQLIRKMVAREMDMLREAMDRGENVHQLTLDLQDAWELKIADYPEEERSWLRDIYLQELDAAHSYWAEELQSDITQKQIELAAIEEEAERQTMQWAAIGGLVALIVLIAVVVAIMQ